MPLTGTFQRTLDEKQRLAIPKRFRDLLVEQDERLLFLAPETDQSLALYAPRRFEERATLFANDPSGRSEARVYQRLYYSQAEGVELDAQGRIRLPERLIKFARLQQDVVLIGVNDHVELWDRGIWEQFLEAHGPTFDQLASDAFGR